MTSNEALIAVIDALNAADIPYMLVGSYSCNFYGVPRATKDADIVIQLDREGIDKLLRHLDRRIRLERQMSFETITATTRYVFSVEGIPFKIELFNLSDDAHDQERFTRRVAINAWRRQIWAPSAEDVVITKLRWSRRGNRNKDLDDAKNVVAVVGDQMDWEYLRAWCEKHQTTELLTAISASLK